MTPLDSLIQEARSLADPVGTSGSTPAADASELERQLQICNACRYCEGFCAVFPAMTRRLQFASADLHYLANLCHNCGACLHACQYAPPHDFGVNVPQAMARVRGNTYARYAWPQGMGRLYQRNGLAMSLALVAALAFFLFLTMQRGGTGNFYDVIPHGALVAMFGPIFLWVTLALGMGVRRYWRDITPATSGAPLTRPAAREGATDVLRLTYLGGGHGEGCHNDDDAYSLARKRAHHLTFYGFMLCFAATSVATVLHYALGWQAPYDLPSLPKLLGVPGGVMLLLGSLSLLRLHWQRDPQLVDQSQRPMDLGFIVLLALTSGTGLGLWLARGSVAMPAWLTIHLATVMALFLTMPYGKFAHGVFRTAALLRFAVEKRQKNTLGLGDE